MKDSLITIYLDWAPLKWSSTYAASKLRESFRVLERDWGTRLTGWHDAKQQGDPLPAVPDAHDIERLIAAPERYNPDWYDFFFASLPPDAMRLTFSGALSIPPGPLRNQAILDIRAAVSFETTLPTLSSLAEVFPAEYGRTASMRMLNLLDQPTEAQQAGWHMFLGPAFPELELPEGAEMTRLVGGGRLLTLGRHEPDLDSSEDLARLRFVADQLNALAE